MIVRSAPPEHYDWIASRANLVISSQFRAIEAMNGEDKILGMVGFDGWTPNAVSVHIALERPELLRRMVRVALGTAFTVRNVVIAPVLSNNARSIKMVEGVGFTRSGELKDAWEPGVDLLLYQMRRDQCRWIREALRWVA